MSDDMEAIHSTGDWAKPAAQVAVPEGLTHPHKTMTRDEYDGLVLEGWHMVCHNVDGFGGTGIRYLAIPPTIPVSDDDEAFLSKDTADLVDRFSHALKEKLWDAQLKYGFWNGWKSPDWMDECRDHLRKHIEKGDPRDVAAYCAFLWYHGESTALTAQAQPVAQEAVLIDPDMEPDGWLGVEHVDNGVGMEHLEILRDRQVDSDDEPLYRLSRFKIAALSQPAAPQWQTIETAPKDKDIIGYFIDHNGAKEVDKVFWCELEERWLNPCGDHDFPVTLLAWQPLPATPSDKEKT